MAIDFDLSTILAAVLLLSPVLWYFRKKKGYSLVEMSFLALFFAYLVGVASKTLFPIYIDSSMREAAGQNVWEHMRLIPFVDLTKNDVKTSLLNILLFIPFGFLLLFFRRFRLSQIMLYSLLSSMTIEFLQFAFAFVSGFTLRFIDVNDVIFNVFGAGLGIILFRMFVLFFRALIRDKELDMNPILEYLVVVTNDAHR